MLSYQTTIPVTSEIYEGPAHIAEIECKAEIEFDLDDDRSLIFEVAALHFDGASLKKGHVLFAPIVAGIDRKWLENEIWEKELEALKEEGLV